ncbi:cytochrome P450 2F2-like [Sarcophilus harrisii]
MLMLPLLLLGLLLLALGLLSRGPRGSRSRLPPGPAPLPLLGNLLQLGPSSLDKRLIELSRRFGPVFTVHLGPQPCVVLSGADTLREALLLQADAFAGRGGMASLDRCTRGKGIVFSNGPRWHSLRTFTVGSLKALGVGTRSIAERIQEEAAVLVRELSLHGGTPLNPLYHIRNAVANVICSVVFGERYDHNDPDFRVLLNLLNDNFQIMSSQWGQMYNIFPSFLDWIPGPHHRIFRNFQKLQAFISEEIKKHKESRQPEEPRNFIDFFLGQMEKEKQDPGSHFYEETLVMTTHNLFFGGTETTSTTIHYGLLILLKYPSVAEKIQEEVDSVVGRERPPCLQDRDHLPYTNAVIHEIQRFISVVPMGLPHVLTQDTHFHGHLLLKGTTIIPLLISAHRDQAHFKDPENFNPNNFLDDEGNFQNNEAFMPFALGKRICLGAGLARMEIFLFLTTILQRFTLHSVKRPEELDLSPKSTGLGNVSPPYELYLKIR